MTDSQCVDTPEICNNRSLTWALRYILRVTCVYEKSYQIWKERAQKYTNDAQLGGTNRITALLIGMNCGDMDLKTIFCWRQTLVQCIQFKDQCEM